MAGAESLLAGPWGPAAAIAAMTLATLICRFSGYVAMRFVRPTPRVEAALAALPGAIVASTVVPIALSSGAEAIVGVAAAILAMRLLRREIVAMVVGMAVVAAIRALV